jgi:SAM-dependent methyltransferase
MRQHIETETIKNSYNTAYKEEINRITAQEGILEFEFICKIIEKYITNSLNVVYDIGSGCGKYTEYFLRKGVQVGCVDISENLVNYFRSTIEYKFKEQLLFNKVCCATKLRWIPSESADMVVLMGPMYHITDILERRKVWYRMNKILKKSSFLIVVFLDCLDNSTIDLITKYNIVSYKKFTTYDISQVMFGGFKVPQFRCSPQNAELETIEWFDMVAVQRFPEYSTSQIFDSSCTFEKNPDQYIAIFKKK